MIISLIITDKNRDWDIAYYDADRDVQVDFKYVRGTVPLNHMMLFVLDKIANSYPIKYDRQKITDELMGAFGAQIINESTPEVTKL
jgi:hypothetical protein